MPSSSRVVMVKETSKLIAEVLVLIFFDQRVVVLRIDVGVERGAMAHLARHVL